MGGKKTACETRGAYGKAEMIVILNRKYACMWLPVILNESRITVDDAMCVNMTNTILRGIHSNGRPFSLLGVWELTNEVMKTTVKKKNLLRPGLHLSQCTKKIKVASVFL